MIAPPGAGAHVMVTFCQFGAGRIGAIHAGNIAGLQVARLVNEPTAASLAYGLDRLGQEVTRGRQLLVGGFGEVDDPRVRRPDIARARSTLGWEPRVPLDAGLRRTIEYLRGVVGR